MDNDVKLCECGCGQHAPITKKTNSTIGHVRGQPVRFIHGHNSRGTTISPEHKAHLRESHLRRPLKAEALPSTIHTVLTSRHPKSGRCEECGKAGRTDYAFLWHQKPYTRLRADYRELCRRCHMAYDIAIGVRPRRIGVPNHERTTKTSREDHEWAIGA